MDYSRFERLTIGVGAVAIMATATFSLYPAPDAIELVAQLLVLAVLVGAVRWGRRGGTFTAVVATVAYILMRIDWVASASLAPEFSRLVLMRAASYGLVGIAGGEACTRIKYAFARSQDDLAIDPTSRVYTADFITRMVRTAVVSFRRYGAPFSVIIVEVDGSVTSGLRAGKTDSVVRAIATYLRSELRLVDDIGRLRNGSFLVLLPQTGHVEAEGVSARLASGLRDSIGIADGAIRTHVFGSLDDLAEIEALASEAAAA
jgi:GGDEF domain-containing protein